MRRSVLLVGCVLALMAVTAWGQQSVFDFANTSPGGTFTATVVLPDGSQLASSGVQIAPSSALTAPDTSTWNASGLVFPVTGSVTFPDRSVLNSAGLALSATSTLRGPDSSSWNSGGVTMAAGKQFSLANGTSAAPALSFSSQATAGLYREAVDDLRLVLSGSIPAWRAYKLNATTGGVSVPLGASTGYAVVGGRFCTSTTSAPTTGTTIQTLATCTLPADALSVDGMGVKVKAWGQTAANGNSKLLELYVGATVCATLTSTVNNGAIVLESTILRTGAAAEECVGTGVSGAGTAHGMRATPAADTTAGIALAVKATTATSAGDFTFKGMTVELIN